MAIELTGVTVEVVPPAIPTITSPAPTSSMTSVLPIAGAPGPQGYPGTLVLDPGEEPDPETPPNTIIFERVAT